MRRGAAAVFSSKLLRTLLHLGSCNVVRRLEQQSEHIRHKTAVSTHVTQNYTAAMLQLPADPQNTYDYVHTGSELQKKIKST